MQLSGAWSAEVPVDQLADEVADRVVARLRAAAREATGGGDVYERPAEPDPGAGPRRGMAGFGGLHDDGTVQEEGPTR